MQNGPANPTRLLLQARTRAWRNRLAHLSPSSKKATFFGIILGAGALLIGGHLGAPALLVPPIETATPTGLEPRSSQVAGAAALELAFWLTAFTSSVLSFRTMELLFRRDDIRSVDKLPLTMRAYFTDRVVYGLLEVAAVGVTSTLFFLPMMWHGKPWVALACALLSVGGPLVTLGAGLGVQLFFGGAEFGRPANTDRAVVDGYGGAGQFFIFSPGIALAISIVAVLLLKLGLGEMIRLESFNRATAVGLALTAALGFVGAAVGWSYFSKSYLRMLAGFREADFVGFEPPMDYQTSAYDKPQLGENLVGAASVSVFRRHVLQYGRRFALTRYMYALLWVLYAVALWSLSADALPTWAATSPLIFLAILTNPWTRLSAAGIRTMPMQALPVPKSAEDRASSIFALRESLLFMAPFALIALTLRGLRTTDLLESSLVAGALLLGTLATWSLCSVVTASRASTPSPLAYYAAATFGALACIAATAATPFAGLISATALTLISVIALKSLGSKTSNKEQHA